MDSYLDSTELNEFINSPTTIMKAIIWDQQIRFINIFNPKLLANEQGIHDQIHQFFRSKNKSHGFPFVYTIKNDQILFAA